MIIKTNLVPSPYHGIAIWPFILVKPEYAENKGLMVHEMVHYEEQRGLRCVVWWFKYAVSKKFRIAAEVRAYKAQIACGGISLEGAAKWLQTYDKNLTYSAALRLLSA